MTSFIFMTHPSRNGGEPFPVQVWEEDGVKMYRPFDEDGSEFEWDERDSEWAEVPDANSYRCRFKDASGAWGPWVNLGGGLKSEGVEVERVTR